MVLNQMLQEDIVTVLKYDFIPWENLKNKTIFITGATGLVGYNLVSLLLYANQEKHLDLKIIALVRNQSRALERLGEEAVKNGCLKLIVGDVTEYIKYDGTIDYIIHGAAQTASQAMVKQPVETILTAVKGTENVLALAKEKKVMGFVYLSSMEIYGYPTKGHKVKESEIGMLTPLVIRNSYPISKLQSESLCCAYVSEFNLPIKIARLTQTIGAGINYNDNRVFAEFARCAIEKRDIVLRTKGETERSYVYALDAAAAILTILFKGKSGEAYNVADESTYSSIAQMAEFVAKNNNISVRYELQDAAECGYLNTLYMNLDTCALKELGWVPTVSSGVAALIKRLVNFTAR